MQTLYNLRRKEVIEMLFAFAAISVLAVLVGWKICPETPDETKAIRGTVLFGGGLLGIAVTALSLVGIL